MAAGGMCIRKEKTAAEFTGFFPNELKTTEESVLVVKRMVAVAVSYITYLRGIFPEDAYKSKYLEDVCLKVLTESSNTPGANKVVKWMMGCFDAIEKQYLQIIFIGVCTDPNDPNRIIESYQFRFKYTGRGPHVDIMRNRVMELHVTAGETKRDFVVLIRKLFLLIQNLEALPNNVYLSMKLYYYDDITPADYQPPGFKEAEQDSLWFEGVPVHFKVGSVQTGFHSLAMSVSAEQGRVEKLQMENHFTEAKQGSTNNPPETKQIQNPVKTCDENDLPSEDESAQFKKPKRLVVKRKAAGSTLARKKRKN
ncbi:zebrafish testis-expressed 38 isoform X1 [Gouania willdenowi]|uniref:zebrafish testis-expressed 38 isoform X1 n=2 Tax=Gouania willdenowi TaxID=441366 RepID=UPI0010558920|nr:HORMA domain-containing protein 1-like isoform X1 [Gouania willdenowi]